MKVVLDLTYIPSLQEEGEVFRVPACFLPIMGKYFIQHTLEYLAEQGFTDFQIYLSSYADELEVFLGDGTRWGIKTEFHLIKKSGDVLKRVSQAAYLEQEELFLFCSGLTLPLLKKEQTASAGRIVCDKDASPVNWFVTSKAALAAETPLPEVPVPVVLSVASSRDYLDSMKKALNKEFPGLIFIGKEVKKGIWVGPGVRLPAESRIIPPVYIGGQVRLSESCIVGPNVQLGKGSIVDKDSYIVESSILNGSYIGKGLDIKQSLVFENQILNTVVGTVYTAKDEVFLTSIDAEEVEDVRKSVSIFTRLLALLLAIITLPVWVLLFLGRLLFHGKKALYFQHMILIPQKRPAEPGKTLKTRRFMTFEPHDVCMRGKLIKHFLWYFIPGLWSVAAGKLRFCGAPSRSLEEFGQLSKDWQGLYLRSYAGLITEADILYKEQPEEEMLFASEMFYSVNDNLSYNTKMVGKYLARLFSDKKRI